jgi:hypothetical protein
MIGSEDLIMADLAESLARKKDEAGRRRGVPVRVAVPAYCNMKQFNAARCCVRLRDAE